MAKSSVWDCRCWSQPAQWLTRGSPVVLLCDVMTTEIVSLKFFGPFRNISRTQQSVFDGCAILKISDFFSLVAFAFVPETLVNPGCGFWGNVVGDSVVEKVAMIWKITQGEYNNWFLVEWMGFCPLRGIYVQFFFFWIFICVILGVDY